MPVTVVVADDSARFRDALRQVLAGRAGIEVVASSEDLGSLLEAAERLRPSVVLTDMRMPPTETDEGLQAAVRLGRSDPGIGVLVLGQGAEPVYASALLASSPRGRGYLLKERAYDGARLAAAIASVAAGGCVLDPSLVAALLAAGTRAGRLTGLAPPDLELLARVTEGWSDAELAAWLELTEAAAQERVDAALRPLGVSRTDDVSARVRGVVRALSGS